MKYYKKMTTPVGVITIVATDTHLTSVLWAGSKRPADAQLATRHAVLNKTEKQLTEYFEGKRKVFDLAIVFSGTEFQERVWGALTKIPFGETWSYKQLANVVGNPKACRAVGAANGKNPLSIIIPCHRVVGIRGTLTGFAGGLQVKEALLNFEKQRGQWGKG